MFLGVGDALVRIEYRALVVMVIVAIITVVALPFRMHFHHFALCIPIIWICRHLTTEKPRARLILQIAVSFSVGWLINEAVMW